MAALIDRTDLAKDQWAELYEGGIVWIIQDNGKRQEIKLDAKEATALFDFLGVLCQEDRQD